MTDPGNFTTEHRSWQWEMMLQYEEGSMPSSAWNEASLAVVAEWYAKNLPREQATARYAQYYERNRRRLQRRLDGASVDTNAIDALDKVWQSLLTRHFDAQG